MPDTSDRDDSTDTTESSTDTTATDQTDSSAEPDQSQRSDPPTSEQWLDDTAGHGAGSSAEDWVRANHSPVSHDGRALTRTTFYSGDVSTTGPGQAHRDQDEKRSWDDLAKWNDGMYSDVSRGVQNYEADKRRWLETFAGQLGCTSYHRDRAEYILDEMDMGPFMGAHTTSECVILSVLSLVIDSDVREFENRAIERDAMEQLLADLELCRRDLVNARHKIHRNASHFLSSDTLDR